jgi:hypothetical protein
VVERAELTVESVGVLAVGAGIEQVDIPGVREHPHGVFLRVGVEVADEEDVVGLLWVGGDAIDHRREPLRRGGALRVELALAIGRLLAVTTLRLQVVRDDREDLAGVERLEGLRDGLARDVPDGIDIGEALANRRHDGRLEDDGVRDEVAEGRVGERARRRDIVPRALARGGVEPRDEVGERLIEFFAELDRVLDLLQGDDVGTEAVDGRDDLGLLDVECCLCARAASIRVHRGEGREVVVYVEAADLEVSADLRRLCRAGVRRREGGLRLRWARIGERGGRLQAPVIEAVAEDERGAEVDGVPVAHHLVRREVRLLPRVGVVAHLDAVAVVEEDAVGPVGRRDRVGFRPGRGRLGALHGEITGVEPERAEVVELVTRAHGVTAGGGYELALVCLTGVADNGVGQRCRLRNPHAGLDELGRRDGRGAHLRLVEVLTRRARDPDEVADRDSGVGVAEEHEDAVGRTGCGIRFAAGALGLDDHAAVAGCPAIVGGDDTLDRDRLAGERRRRTRALHLSDRVGHLCGTRARRSKAGEEERERAERGDCREPAPPHSS